MGEALTLMMPEPSTMQSASRTLSLPDLVDVYRLDSGALALARGCELDALLSGGWEKLSIIWAKTDERGDVRVAVSPLSEVVERALDVIVLEGSQNAANFLTVLSLHGLLDDGLREN